MSDVKYTEISKEMKNKCVEILEILPDDPGEALTLMCYLMSRMILSIEGAEFSAICSAIEGNMQKGHA